MLKDTNPKDAVGVRKWRQYCTVPITVVWELGVAMLEGARKYGRHNYRVAGVRASVYVDAAKGHIDSWWEGEDIDADSGLSHITKAMASLAVLRDAMINDMVTDDRPPKVKNFEAFKATMQDAVESIMDRHPDAREPFTEQGQQAARAGLPTVTPDEIAHRLAEEKSRAALQAKSRLGGKPVDEVWVDDLTEVERRGAYVVAHRDLGIEFVHPDHVEFDRMHVWGGLTTKQLCNLVRAEAKDGQGCGMNHACLTGNLTIYRPDIFDGLLRRVVDRISQQDTFECRLEFPHGGFRECSTRLTAADWAVAVPGIKVTEKPYHGVMKPKGGPA